MKQVYIVTGLDGIVAALADREAAEIVEKAVGPFGKVEAAPLLDYSGDTMLDVYKGGADGQ